MTDELVPPFSARNRGPQAQIADDFPDSARMGLVHLLIQLAEMKYVDNAAVSKELQRTARVNPDEYTWQNLLFSLTWQQAFNFCERLYSHLAQDVERYNRGSDEYEVVTPKSQVQEYITRELQLLFLEENLAFEFSNGLVRRRGRRNTADQVERAGLVLGDPRLSAARRHFNKALKYFRNAFDPDYENTVKEAVCAVEATARVLFPSGGSTLGDVVKSITGSDAGQLPKPIANTFHGLYGFRNGGQGVGHGGATGGAATKEIAEYALALAASQIVLLVDLSAASEPDVPF